MEYSVYVSFRCDADIERRVRIEAAKRDMNRTEFIIEALREKLEQIDATGTQDPAQSHV
ncbi:ribbon-helix-helix domain-containing protein [Patescibacteria group bacterium]|nr:ribbon-helix-helix domain-containing protein [Patescibacteria group bacterium]